MDLKIITPHNTDGRVNKLVTVFVCSCTQDKFVMIFTPRPHTFLAKVLGFCTDAIVEERLINYTAGPLAFITNNIDHALQF